MLPSPGGSVLLADRNSTEGREIVAFLRDRKYDVEWVDEGEKAFNRLEARAFDVLITEVNLRRVDGLRLMRAACDRNPEVCVIFIGEPGDLGLANEAMRLGAYDFQTKPVNLAKLDAVIRRGLDHQRVIFEQHELQRRLDEHYGLGGLIGNSRPMLMAYNAVRQVAETNTPVLICGEAGTGKDLFAQAIHNNSARRNKAFVKLSCSGVATRPLGEMLFSQSPGETAHIDLADRGTLYLDEIGELSPSLQDMLVEVIDRHRYPRKQDGRNVAVDVRLVASTVLVPGVIALNERLRAHFQAATITLPPLRERREDIALLVQHIMRERARTLDQRPPEIAPNALDLLMRHDWPGNVRELRNILEGMMSSRPGTASLTVRDIPQYIQRGSAVTANDLHIPLGTSLPEIERLAILETMKFCGHNKEQCAKVLGIGLRTLYRKLNEYEVQ